MSEEPVVADCAGCGEPLAAICTECLRAAALRDWGGVDRHPESVFDQPCRLCGAGPPTWCPICWPGEVIAYRLHLAKRDPDTYGHLLEG